ncbi:hypothetical protein J7E50_09835 [Pedobacter sp. ISL-68]|uniref:hypothetical protein n=1 Tax=unclassified Pedobacter TaxID=2628915 RepID=UPI001BEBA964|nr:MULTISPECIES: hypothetical protein [unclassified Pedobacter]MBT2561130.1 hypothetical protein [Pedobacter sp. ISL-64]MBT2590519.1 hypothetical protein [Pedobacter sp. ISL-68]
MFDLIPVNIDTDKVAKYRKYVDTTPTFLDHQAYTIIPSKYRDAYFGELKDLFSLYKVSEAHLDNFLYIIGQHFFIYEIIKEKKADAIECYEPLKFLHSYQLQTQHLTNKAKSESALKDKLASRYLEVILPNYSDDNPITLSNTDFVIKAIYQLFKKQYQFSLKELLADYDDIPSLEVLTKLLNETKYMLDHATHYLVAEIAEDLLDYMNSHMIGELSRKQYLFIFDIILLSGVFIIVDDEESANFDVTTDFKPTYIPNIEKTTYLKRVVKNYRKHLANTR